MFQFLAITQAGCRRSFPRHLLHRITTPAFAAVVALVAQPICMQRVNADQATRPNIVLIMSDDMGYSDIQPYGGEIATPNLQRLAEKGLRLSQFYNTARCCPTRASLLTGLYPHQAGVGHMMVDRSHPGYRGELNRNCVTIAEALKPAGYATFMCGKWHVTPQVKPDGPRDNWPRQRGFDRFYGTIHGAGSFFDPNTLTRDNTQISPYADPEYQPETYYYTDAISDHAVKFIAEHFETKQSHQPAASTTDPFFLYVSYTAAHWPLHALPQDIAKYAGKYDSGYHPVRAARLEKLKALGLVNPETILPPDAENWNQVEHRAWELACMEVYAAMIDNMDQGIGRIIQQLEAVNQLENTLIFFLQDNGGCAENYGRRPGNDFQSRPHAPLPAMRSDELQTAMQPSKTRDGFPIVTGPGILPGPADTYIAYGRGWANVSNTPFREYKHWVHEGGISTPLIAHWPQGISRRGEIEHQPGHLIDIMATCVAVAGASYPVAINDQPITPLEGRSLVPLFEGKQIQRDALYWEHEGNRAVRVGDWKLVAKENAPWELYDLSVDRIESHDRAPDMPEKVQELQHAWETWAARANVLPLGTWRGKQQPATSQNWSRQSRFELTGKQSLPRDQSPPIHGKAFRITARLGDWSSNGVIVAQGGSSNGYSLFMQDDVLKFGVRQSGKLQVVQATAPQTAGKEIVIHVDAQRIVELQIDGKSVGQGKLTQLLKSMPQDGLDVGQDDKGQVGDYSQKFPYSGKIESVVIELTGKLD